EVAACPLLIDRCGWLTGRNNLVQLQPLWNQLFAAVLQNAAVKAGLGADEEGFAFGSECVSLPVCLGEKVQAYENIHDRSETALGGSGCGRGFRKRFWTGVQYIEDAMTDGCFQSHGWNIAPGKLHDSFRRYRRICVHDHVL